MIGIHTNQQAFPMNPLLPLDEDSVLEAFRNIRVYEHREDGKRAVNKPLLLLLALGIVQREGRRLLSYVEIETKLISLLEEFGPHRATYSASYPFWYLQNDDDGRLWIVDSPDQFAHRKGKKSEPTVTELRTKRAQGGLHSAVFDKLVSNPKLLREAARELLIRHFPETLHDDIVSEVGLNLDVDRYGKGIRDPRFRTDVLSAYAHRCAICGYEASLAGKHVGLEAAHIKWVQMLGPNKICNGLAMCSLHHKLFDAGAFTIMFVAGVYRIVFSGKLSSGQETFRNSLVRLHQANLNLLPLNPADHPGTDFLHWHYREVFKPPPLQISGISA